MALSTFVLVIGIRESATTNAVLVATKVGVVLFVIGVGCWYINTANWTSIPARYRNPSDVPDLLARHPQIAALLPADPDRFLTGKRLLKEHPEVVDLLVRSVEDDIKNLPDANQLAQRPDLARFLPAKVISNLGHQEPITGAELLKDPEV